MKSTAQMLEQCKGLIDTSDVTEWENGFLKNVTARAERASGATALSGPQVDCLEKIWRKHFA